MAGLFVAPFAPAPQADATIAYYGQTYIAMSKVSNGVTFSAHVKYFLHYVPIDYHFTVKYNGNLIWTGKSPGTYHTDRYGHHFRYPSNNPENTFQCGRGTYEIRVWVQHESDSDF